ncbi:MAG: hypothetical protein DMG60_11310 [Acidobacteria bacterium]|nr:MAG: hypothetical protein DMG60_11310 [Acidobacteriota bacterium]
MEMATAPPQPNSYLAETQTIRGGNMHRLLTFFAACVLSGAMAFAQGAATGQAPAGGTQSSSNSTSAVPNSNGTSPSSAQGQASRTPSTPNQALPGDSNPANAATRDGQANGSAVRPNADNRSANPPDSSDTNGVKRDDTGSNPASPHAPARNPNTGTRGTAPWLWIAVGVIAIIALISALSGRNRAETDIDERDPRWRSPREPDVIRRDDIDRDETRRRAS